MFLLSSTEVRTISSGGKGNRTSLIELVFRAPIRRVVFMSRVSMVSTGHLTWFQPHGLLIKLILESGK